jgi:MYXO-CTERM domain-containing protein
MTPLLLLSLLAVPSQAAGLTADEIARRDALLSTFDAVFTPADAQDVAAVTGRPVCVTGLVKDLKDDWHLLTPADRERITQFLAPWKTDLADDPPRMAAGPGHEASCHGQYGAYHLLGDHFVVEWDSSSVERYAEGFLEALEYAWDKEVDEFGWNPAASTPDYPILAYIYDYDSYAGAYTSVEQCSGYGYVPYIVAYSGSFSWDTWADDMAAHEFNHALQFSTSLAPEFWFWESTATWIEDDVYPSHNTWSEYVGAYTESPWIAQNASSQDDYEIFYHMYGMAIFNFYLDEYAGGHVTIRDMWKWAGDHARSYSDEPVWNLAEALGFDWDEIMTGFMAVVTVMDFTDRAYFPAVRIQDTVVKLPASGTPNVVVEPESLGQNFIVFDDGLFVGGQDLHLSFDGEDGVLWYVVLVAEDGTSIGESVVVEVDEFGVGDAWITPHGGDVTLVVSPWDDEAYGAHYDWQRTPTHTYTWSAEMGDRPEDTGIDPTDDTATDDTGDDLPDRPDSEDGGICGCTSTGSPGSHAAWTGLLLAAAALLRRRR